MSKQRHTDMTELYILQPAIFNSAFFKLARWMDWTVDSIFITNLAALHSWFWAIESLITEQFPNDRQAEPHQKLKQITFDVPTSKTDYHFTSPALRVVMT